jgi:hypothetical protein
MDAGLGQLRRGVLALADLANDQYLPSVAAVPGAGRSAPLVPGGGFLQDALKKECSNLDCRQGRGMSWRSRRLVAFEASWRAGARVSRG